MSWWGVSIGTIIVAVATVVAAVVAAVVATPIGAAVVGAVLVIAPPLRVVTPLTSCRTAIVTGLRLIVVAMVTLALSALVVRCLLAAKQQKNQSFINLWSGAVVKEHLYPLSHQNSNCSSIISNCKKAETLNMFIRVEELQLLWIFSRYILHTWVKNQSTVRNVSHPKNKCTNYYLGDPILI